MKSAFIQFIYFLLLGFFFLEPMQAIKIGKYKLWTNGEIKSIVFKLKNELSKKM